MSLATVTTRSRRSALERVVRSEIAVERLDDLLRACIATRFDAALTEGAQLDALPERSLLHGWTVAVKDNIDVAGMVRSDGLPPPHPPAASHDAPAVACLREAGALVVAKANLEELSFGATTQNAYWGSCRNPWDPARLPGGSSGGSAVAVATGMVDAALGTDTGGSLRNPAAFCGVTALRSSPGVICRRGVTPLSPTFDAVGPIARTAADLRRLMKVLTGATTQPPAVDLRGLRVGVPSSYFFDELDSAVGHGCDELQLALASAGCRVRMVHLPAARVAAEALAVLLNVEAAIQHAHLLDDPRLAPEVRDRLALGVAASGRERNAARRAYAHWSAQVSEAFEAVDVLLSPAVPFVAPPIGSAPMIELSRRINRCTSPWSLAPVPVLAVPLSAPDGLPVGGQVIAAPGRDMWLVEVGVALQARTDWHRRQPPIAASGHAPPPATL